MSSVALAALVLFANAAVARPWSFATAEKLWAASKDKPGYDSYANQFVKYNNRIRLDVRSGCYRVSSEPVTLLLMFDSSGKVETVLANVSGPKASCFIRTYRDHQLSKPPFAPFVLKLTMS